MNLLVKNLFREQILQALYNAKVPAGLGVLHARGPLNDDEASEVVSMNTVEGQTSFDYVFGRPIKIGMLAHESGGVLVSRVDLFDRGSSGPGAAQRALEAAGAVVEVLS